MCKIICLATIFAIIGFGYGSANIINIPEDYGTIQTGINASSTGDTILVNSGQYPENLDFGQHDVVLASRYLTTGDQSFISSTVINGSQQGSVIRITDLQGSSLAIIGLTIQAGLVDTTGGGLGGGIRCVNSNPLIANNFIYGNISLVYGGGICCSGSDVIIRNNLIMANVSRYVAGHGGGIACIESDAMIVNNTLTQNAADLGGGIYIDGGNVEVTNCIIYNNLAPYYEQILVGSGDPLFRYCDIEDGWPGEEIITDDPLLKSSNFHLSWSGCGDNIDSPCIDAGDPAISDLVLDCAWGLGTERSDIGAFGGGELIPTGISDDNHALPWQLLLLGNFPNPFNSSTAISYELNSGSEVTITVYDVLGRKLEEIPTGFQSPGKHNFIWDSGNRASGTYFYRISGGGPSQINRMTLLK